MIHSDGRDIWDLMPEPELRKLEPVLSQAVEYSYWKKDLDKADTPAAVRDVRSGLFETENLNLTRDQITALHKEIDQKEAALTAALSKESEPGKSSVLKDLESTKPKPRESKASRKPKKQKEETR